MPSGIMWGKDRRSREEKNEAARRLRAEKKARATRIANLNDAIDATRWRFDRDGSVYKGTAFEWSPEQIEAMLEVKIGDSTEFWAGPNVTITRIA
jgi:hypothetical protein